MAKRFSIDVDVSVVDFRKNMRVVTTDDELDDAYDRDDAVLPALIGSMRRLGLRGKFTFVYDYPLSRPARFTEVLKPSMTAKDLIALGAKHYKEIYRLEDRDVGHKTKNIPGMLNRDESEGRFGIWGHDIGDLVFENLKVNAFTRVVSFDVGS